MLATLSQGRLPPAATDEPALEGSDFPGADIWKGHLFLICSTDKNMETVSAHLFDGSPKPVVNKAIQLVWLVIIKKVTAGTQHNDTSPSTRKASPLVVRKVVMGGWEVPRQCLQTQKAQDMWESQHGVVLDYLPAQPQSLGKSFK